MLKSINTGNVLNTNSLQVIIINQSSAIPTSLALGITFLMTLYKNLIFQVQGVMILSVQGLAVSSSTLFNSSIFWKPSVRNQFLAASPPSLI